jgi:hypothetical protein
VSSRENKGFRSGHGLFQRILSAPDPRRRALSAHSAGGSSGPCMNQAPQAPGQRPDRAKAMPLGVVGQARQSTTKLFFRCLLGYASCAKEGRGIMFRGLVLRAIGGRGGVARMRSGSCNALPPRLKAWPLCGRPVGPGPAALEPCRSDNLAYPARRPIAVVTDPVGVETLGKLCSAG